MAYKTATIQVGYGMKWPTETLLLSLTADREVGDAEWWRRMALLQNAAARTSDTLLLDALDKAKLIRWGSGFPVVEVTTPQNLASSGQSTSQPNQREMSETNAPDECFKNTSEFVKQQVKTVVDDCYLGSSANLALIAITLFDHNLLKRRNAHTAFVKSLVEWGIIKVADENMLKSIVSGIADKHKRMPKEGYKDWSQDFINDKTTCENIAKKLGQTIPYSR